ncbi:acyl-CoA thioesterase [Limobrevibacterium gyesilva]|uniref:Acyl-CoA thioesterase n=1 Tax=Limobrevibacterium gyesilva TaxID=2991712 RepID=A0AA41YJ15_9PROT|nr:thioesterase family protein [Limobrevibacterium gyesilva]MCW3474531.1 acyl-CoA thioesterase [Limobrevibacterium gyesilva]
MSRPAPPSRAEFRYFLPITTRWMDNDAYGHVNNVVYYSWIDTAVNRFLLDHRLLEIGTSPTVGIVAETGCRYLSQIAYPDEVTVGLAVAKLGRSSVRYAVAIFRADDEQASAEGHFVHVYVDRATMRPVPIPDHVRAEMEKIHASG